MTMVAHAKPISFAFNQNNAVYTFLVEKHGERYQLVAKCVRSVSPTELLTQLFSGEVPSPTFMSGSSIENRRFEHIQLTSINQPKNSPAFVLSRESMDCAHHHFALVQKYIDRCTVSQNCLTVALKCEIVSVRL